MKNKVSKEDLENIRQELTWAYLDGIFKDTIKYIIFKDGKKMKNPSIMTHQELLKAKKDFLN